MNRSRIQEKGIILFVVLATIFVVILLGNILIGIISSQSRLTRHKVGRIQAYYAAMAGVNYAFDKLRKGDDPTCWPTSPTASYTNRLCRSGCSGCDINDLSFPNSILYVEVTVGILTPPSGINNTRLVRAKAIYTYTP